jgi:hypothetical protein
MKKSIDEPKYKKDVLEQLLHIDGTPAAQRLANECISAMGQACSRAADEIERLRKENKVLRSKTAKSSSRSSTTHRLWVIGYIGNKSCYLDVDKKDAIDRYLKDNPQFAEDKDYLPIFVMDHVHLVEFNDEFEAYDAWCK